MGEKSNEVLQGIKDHLGGRGIDTSVVSLDADLLRDLDLDSLDTVELTLGLEERFAIEIPDSELEDVVTVGDVVELIERKLTVGA